MGKKKEEKEVEEGEEKKNKGSRQLHSHSLNPVIKLSTATITHSIGLFFMWAQSRVYKHKKKGKESEKRTTIIKKTTESLQIWSS